MKTYGRAVLTIMILVLSASMLAASEISFSGGYTKIDMQQGNRRVILSGGARVSEPFDACAVGVYLHGRAGDLIRDTETAYCMSPEQVIFKGFRDAFIECLANEL